MASSRLKHFSGAIFFSFLLSVQFLMPARLQAASIAYSYDPTGRLVSASYGDGQRVALSYDDAGNITGLIVSGASAAISAIVGLLLSENQSNPFSSVLNR